MAKKKEKMDTRYNLATYWSFVRKYKILIVCIAIILLISESLSLLEKFLFKQVVDNGTAYGNKAITLEVISSILFWVAIVFLAALVVRACMKFAALRLLNRLEGNINRDVKQYFFNHILNLSHGFHTSHKTGALISRINRGAGAMIGLSDFFVFDLFTIIFQVVIVGASLLYFDFRSAVVVGLTVMVFISYSIYIQKRQVASHEKANEAEDIEKAKLADSLTNIDSIKYFGKENYRFTNFVGLTNNTRNALVKFWNIYSWLDAVQSLILGLGTFFLIYFPIKSFLAGEITIGTIVLIYTVYGSVISQVYSFIHGMRVYYRSMTDFHDLFSYGKIEQEVKDKPNAKEAKIEKGEIEYRNVSFNYRDKGSIFRNFNLKINPGEKVALVGHSGSGKTTLVKLLYRFYDVTKGQIFIDGTDLRDFKQESLRSELSIVPQEGVLFDDTIYNNIKFSKPNATRKEVMAAIRFAQLDKLIASLPKKENTIVGERGVKLSGGERQRVSIARALLANKRIIVLDEATSSLDSQTEHDIQSDLKKLLKGRTAVIIAHRLSTIMHADKIIVLEKGKIVQIGKHNELIQKPGLYKKLWSLQKGGYLQD